jgi:hypothetical protein
MPQALLSCEKQIGGSQFPMEAPVALIGCDLPLEWGLSADGARETRRAR